MNASTSFETTSFAPTSFAPTSFAPDYSAPAFIADVEDDGGVVHQPIPDDDFSDFSEDEDNDREVESDSIIQTFPPIYYHPIPNDSVPNVPAPVPDPIKEQEQPECDCGCDAKGNYAYADEESDLDDYVDADADADAEEKEKSDIQYDDANEFVEIEYFMPRMVISRETRERDGVYKLVMDKVKAVVKRFQPYTFVDDDGVELGAYEEIKVGRVKYQYVCKNPYNDGPHVINLLSGTGLEIDNGRDNKNLLDCEYVIVTSVSSAL